MKCKPKIRPRIIFANKAEYLIVAIRERNFDDITESEFLLLNDDGLLQYQNSNDFIIVDNDKSNFVKVDLEDENTSLLIDSDFINIYNKSVDKNDNLEFKTELWDLAWLSKSLSLKNLKTNEFFERINDDHSTKLNTIDGFLLFANDFLLFNKDSDGWEAISFYSVPKENSRLRFEKDRFEKISIEHYESYLTETINNYIFNGNEIKNVDGVISTKVVRKLFLLIDCIFVNGIDNIYKFNEGWSQLTIIDYENNFYILELSHSS